MAIPNLNSLSDYKRTICILKNLLNYNQFYVIKTVFYMNNNFFEAPSTKKKSILALGNLEFRKYANDMMKYRSFFF